MSNRGFTLIEVLVTLVILVLGLLGVAGLMARGQHASFEAYQRQQALSIANDMAERMKSNRAQGDAYAAGAPVTMPLGGTAVQYTALTSGTLTNCATTNCTAPFLAAFDLAMWEGQLIGYGEQRTSDAATVGAVDNANGCIEALDTLPTYAACPAPPAPPSTFSNITYRISVAWQGSEETAAPAGRPTCGTGSYGSSDALRRVVSVDVLLSATCP